MRSKSRSNLLRPNSLTRPTAKCQVIQERPSPKLVERMKCRVMQDRPSLKLVEQTKCHSASIPIASARNVLVKVARLAAAAVYKVRRI